MVSGVGCQVSGVSAASGLKSGQSDHRKETNEHRTHRRRTVSIERPTSNVE
ncbi:hypothetical protein D1AOALGA4SA_5155 [Olavius algarvensis Delta 1 endosymbiont]|nr:hypothetical protein D1AOALGA4SA_5155 [Olavius algarvensis Delta 1 endosymbiont]